ncbi:MAG: Maf family protein [Microthrixaceae bacterium]
MANSVRVILASGSPRRLELLNRVGLSVTVVPADLDESQLHNEDPRAYVARLALAKALAVAPGYIDSAVLAADTAVVVGQKIFSQPADPSEALRMLEELAGITHCVMTAVAVIGPHRKLQGEDSARLQKVIVETALVRMIPRQMSELDWYVRTGEPMDKAGSYAVQGIGAAFVEHIEGDPTTVIGLPVRPTLDLLRQAGVIWPQVAG